MLNKKKTNKTDVVYKFWKFIDFYNLFNKIIRSGTRENKL